jgi:hypothetical protein
VDQGAVRWVVPHSVACHLQLPVSDSCALYNRHVSIMAPIWNGLPLHSTDVSYLARVMSTVCASMEKWLLVLCSREG